MNKNKIFITRLSKILGVCAIILIVFTGCVYKNNKFNDGYIFSEAKEETSNFSYEITQEKLVINSDYSELNISKSDSKNLEVTIEKKVEGDNEQELIEKLKSITCSYENGTLNIMCNDSDGILSSKYVSADIKVPETIKVLETSNDVGDIAINGEYDTITSSVDVGRLCFDGEVKNCNVQTDTGDLEIHLNKVQNDYKYKLSCDIGAINIKVPRGSNINLVGSDKNEVKTGNGVNVTSDGMTIDAKVNVGSIKVND